MANGLYKYKILADGAGVEDIEVVELLTYEEKEEILVAFAMENEIRMTGLSLALMHTVKTAHWSGYALRNEEYVA